MTVVCYPIPGKPKAARVCEAFAAGAGGSVVDSPPTTLASGAAMFYGVRPAVAHLWRQCRIEGRDWYYADNSYFDAGREVYFRITRNAIQHTGVGRSTGERRRRLGVQVAPWRRAGRSIVVCTQSDEFMRVVAGQPEWLPRTLAALREITDRPVVLRAKGDPAPLAAALADAWAVVTYSSAAAIEALLAGVPVVCDPACAAAPMSVPLERIETPWYPAGREQWADVLADHQWTLDEIRRGDASGALHVS